MEIHESKSPTQVNFRFGRDERIFFKKIENNKQTYYLNK